MALFFFILIKVVQHNFQTPLITQIHHQDQIYHFHRVIGIIFFLLEAALQLKFILMELIEHPRLQLIRIQQQLQRIHFKLLDMIAPRIMLILHGHLF